jgi:hypothetical protein
MSDLMVGGLAFVCGFGGAWLGLLLRSTLPPQHLGADSKDVVKLGTGLLATMAALVLSLLIASAKGSYDTQRSELAQLAADVIALDQALAHYGPETKEARELLRLAVVRVLNRMSLSASARPGELEPLGTTMGPFYVALQKLSPENDVQRSLVGVALRMSTELGRTDGLLVEQARWSIPAPFLALLICWVTVIFMSFGLFAPRNATVLVTLGVCALSLSAAIFLILELNQPYRGLVQLSNAPLEGALTHLGQ